MSSQLDASPVELKQRILVQSQASIEALERHAPGTSEFGDVLRDAVSYDDRLALALSMWNVVLADGDHAEIEEATLHQIEATMGITPEDSVEIKTRALG